MTTCKTCGTDTTATGASYCSITCVMNAPRVQVLPQPQQPPKPTPTPYPPYYVGGFDVTDPEFTVPKTPEHVALEGRYAKLEAFTRRTFQFLPKHTRMEAQELLEGRP